MDFVKVLIVGAGAAGLAAAKTLGSSVDFCLIEASDYIGGRIRTVDAGSNVVVDLGAQYIHGQTNNLVYEICRDLNCILVEDEPTAKNFLVATTDHQQVDSNKIMKAFDLFEEVLGDARALFAQRSTPINASFSEYLNKNFKNRLEESLADQEHLFDAILHYVDQSELIENGCSSLSELSLAEYGSFEYLAGSYSTTFQNGGYRPLIKYLKSKIDDERRIRLNSEVISVRFDSTKHQLEVQIRHRNRQETDQTEISTIFCEHLIWTSSLGYLKKNFRSIFAHEPNLIEEKQRAIENLGFDTVNKVVLMYDQRFWSQETKHIVLLHTKEISSIQWSESLKAQQVNDETIKTLVRAIHRYDVLPSTDVPVLICWFGGDAAVLLEDFSDEFIGQLCHEVLCYYLHVPADVHRPKRFIKSEWHKNDFICGSYSYYSVRSTNEDGERLRQVYQPDGIPRIQFAGEATHEQFYSSVHGALESGIREGNRLLSYLK